MYLTRLTDRIERDSDGSEYKVLRYGMWRTAVEAESYKRQYYLVYPDGKREKCPTLEDCRQKMEELAGWKSPQAK